MSTFTFISIHVNTGRSGELCLGVTFGVLQWNFGDFVNVCVLTYNSIYSEWMDTSKEALQAAFVLSRLSHSHRCQWVHYIFNHVLLHQFDSNV